MTSTSDDAPRPPVPVPPGDLATTHPSAGADAATVAPALLGGRAFVLAPFTPATWRAVSQAVVGWVWLLAAGIVALTMIPTSVALVPALGVGVPLLVGSLVVARWFARAEIGRLALQTGARVPPADPRPAARPGWWPAFVAPLRDARAWTATAYAALGAVTSSVVFVLVVALGGAGLAGILVPVYGVGPVLHDALGWPDALLTAALVVVGVVALWLAALAAQGGSLLHVRMARGLLGRTRAAEEIAAAERARAQAEVRTAHVEATRTQVVGAADDERRRIERDLHDGAQQRLVALGVELGAARRRSAADPEAAAVALEHAHREVQETLAELRDLVRGIHPAVLTDRGLDAALSALAARTPLPVTVDAPDDDALAACGAAAQAAAYFVVAEALTNVAKHAGATSARVQVRCADGRLRLVVHDDGRGGAAASPGSGLDGLRSRIAALDGTFDLVSPAGAGTTLTVEVPCAS
ncbi:sensor domain-containing protein [Cellulomonas sp. DKR-3]|uniref:histidine kinase n=1 Tax=Cellulomonas fulva TaxID=2835530 RepID=A0ABS5TXP9_9CELL|nr:sensor histidine kinase [Cellulomonas fulva]MBT0993933.1 sensor domain-containing protein [Cellulomonas fulva]